MFQRIDLANAQPATKADGAPSADQLIEAYDVPLHRQGSVRRELAHYGRRRDLTGGLLASVRVSASRESGRGLKDRLRRLSGAAGVSGLIDGRRALLAVDETGVPAALAIGAMLMTATPPHDMEGLGVLAHRFLGQHVIDCCVGGSEEADDDRDNAHTYATLIHVLMRDGAKCDEERETVTTFEVMCHLAGVTPSTVVEFMMRVVERIEADGPWIDNARTPGCDIVDRIMQQLQLDAILDQLNSDPVVLAAIEQRRQDRRAWQRAHRAAAPMADTVPAIPGLFD